MQQVIIHTTTNFQVVSFGNGLAYELEHKPTASTVFFQGDDAETFRTELKKLTEGTPNLGYDDALQVIWNDYAEVATKKPSGDLTPRLACPDCKDSYHLHDRADARYDPETNEWVVGDREGSIECTECDWSGYEHELIHVNLDTSDASG